MTNKRDGETLMFYMYILGISEPYDHFQLDACIYEYASTYVVYYLMTRKLFYYIYYIFLTKIEENKNKHFLIFLDVVRFIFHIQKNF